MFYTRCYVALIIMTPKKLKRMEIYLNTVSMYL